MEFHYKRLASFRLGSQRWWAQAIGCRVKGAKRQILRISLLILLVLTTAIASGPVGVGRVSASSASSEPGPLATPIPPTLFGMHLHIWKGRSQPWPDIPFGSFRLWDSATGWAQINTAKGKYDWSQLDDWFSKLSEHNVVDVLYTFGRTPPFASSRPDQHGCAYGPGQCAPPKDVNEDGAGSDQYWKDFVTAIATHSKNNRGVHIKYWELWNEPYLPVFWTGTFPQLIRMARDAHEIIHSIDPDAVVLTGPSVPSWPKYRHFLDDYLEAGGGQYADAISFHGYVNPPLKTGDFFRNYAEFRKTLAKYGQDNKPVLDTEGSWGDTEKLRFTDEDQQAAFLAQAYLAHWSLGVQRFYWYAFNGGTGTLSDQTGRGTKAAAAYREVYHWLVGATMTKPCAQEGSMWTCTITKDGHESQIMWNDGGEKSYSPKSAVKKMRDLDGNANPVSGAVKIGAKPVLFEGQ